MDVDLRAIRVRRLTSTMILVGGLATSAAVVGPWSGVTTVLIAIATWAVVIAGSVWLFRRARRGT